jgi:hypothetical protein
MFRGNEYHLLGSVLFDLAICDSADEVTTIGEGM